MKLAVVVQARTGSSRLPNKVLAEVGPAGATAPVLVRMLERVRGATTVLRFSELILATTTDASDDPIVAIGEQAKVRVHRGHPTDLLDRHIQAARAVKADAVVKIPSDCPLIDPAAIDRVIGEFLDKPGRFDFVSNLHPATWPDGNDVEVMTMDALETAWREAQKPYQREHTTPFIWDQPERFRCGNVTWETGKDFSKTHRLVLDYPEDLELIRHVYGALWSRERHFTLSEILKLLEVRPEWRAINRAHLDYSWYTNHLDDLKTINT